MLYHKLWTEFFVPDFDKERYGYQWKAFLKEVHQDYKKLKLSPAYANIKELETGFGVFLRSWFSYKSEFPKDMVGINISDGSITVRDKMQDQISESRIEWFRETIIPALIQTSSMGNEVKSFIYSQLSIKPVGLESADRNYGFLFLKNAGEPKTDAFKFYISPLMDKPSRHKVHLEKTAEFNYSLTCNFNQMKSSLMAANPYIHTAYLIESEIGLPMHESIRPLAKKKLVSFLFGK